MERLRSVCAKTFGRMDSTKSRLQVAVLFLCMGTFANDLHGHDSAEFELPDE